MRLAKLLRGAGILGLWVTTTASADIPPGPPPTRPPHVTEEDLARWSDAGPEERARMIAEVKAAREARDALRIAPVPDAGRRGCGAAGAALALVGVAALAQRAASRGRARVRRSPWSRA